MRQFTLAAVIAATIAAPAIAQNVAPETGDPKKDVKPQEQGLDVKKPADQQVGVQPDVNAPKPSTTSATGGNTQGPHTTP